MDADVHVNKVIVDTHDFDDKDHVEIFNADIINAAPGSTAKLIIGNNEAFNQHISGDCKVRFSLPYQMLLKKRGFNINGEFIVTTPTKMRCVYPFSSKVLSMNDIRIVESGKQISMSIDPEDPTLRDLIRDIAEHTRICPWDPDDTLCAIWDRVSELDLHYSSVIGTTESGYQRFNDVADVMESHIFNCVDITLLFMTLMHMCGMLPVFISVPHHAMPGILVSVNDKKFLKTGYLDYSIEMEYKGQDVRVLPLEGTAIGSYSFEESLKDAKDRLDDTTECVLTIPYLDRIPLMCRRESKVVF